jgi:hypothetical protein
MHRSALRLIRDRQIRDVVVDGIAHVPAEAIDEYRTKASRPAPERLSVGRVSNGAAWGIVRR